MIERICPPSERGGGFVNSRQNSRHKKEHEQRARANRSLRSWTEFTGYRSFTVLRHISRDIEIGAPHEKLLDKLPAT